MSDDNVHVPSGSHTYVAAETAVLSKTYDIEAVDDDEEIEAKGRGRFKLKNLRMSICATSAKETKDGKSYDMTPFLSTPNDTKDPSYSNLTLPYSVMCRQRLHYKGQEMRDQFCKELRTCEMLPNMALDGVRMHRIFQDPHVRIPENEVIRLTRKQQERLNRLLSTNN